MVHRLLEVVLLVVAVASHTRTVTSQGDVTNQLKNIQMMIQGFQTQMTEQLKLQETQIRAVEKLLDNELKAMQMETSSIRTEMKAMQSEVALARKDIKRMTNETTSVKAAMTSLQGQVLPMTTGINSVQFQMSLMAEQLNVTQGHLESVKDSVTAVEKTLSSVGTKTNAVQSEMTTIKQGIETVDNKMTTMASLVNQYKETVVSSNTQQNQCCLKTQNYITTLLSKIQIPTTPTTTPAPAKHCPKDLIQFKDSCYKVGNQKSVPFNRAVELCKQDGAHLVAIESSSENEFLKKLVHQVAGPRAKVWLGGSDRVQEGVWRWESSGSIIKYTNWYLGEPDNHLKLNEDCMTMNAEDNYQWHDVACIMGRGYICELEL